MYEQLLFPAYFTNIAVLGFAHDWMAYISFALSGVFLGMHLQVYPVRFSVFTIQELIYFLQGFLWDRWYSHYDPDSQSFVAYAFGAAFIMIHIILLTIAYAYPDGPYSDTTGTPLAILVGVGLICFLGPREYLREGRLADQKSNGPLILFSAGDAFLFGIAQSLNLLLTVFAVINASRGTS